MLITLRRIVAIFLLPVFLVLFVATLLIWQVQGTFGDPGWIKGELVKADIYNFLYDDAMEPLLEDALDDPQRFLNNDLAELEIHPDSDAPELVGLLRDFLPPEELQSRVELAIDEFVPYITGDTDNFNIQLKLGERVRAWPELVPARLDALDAGDRLSNAVLAPVLDNSLNALETNGLDISMTRERAQSIASDVAPGSWIETQFVNATNDVSGWLTREDENFQITVQFADRVPRATQALKDVLDEANAEQFLFQSLIEPELTKTLGSFTQLSHTVLISDEEITGAIKQVAPEPWIRKQRNAIIDSLSGYISGESDQLALSIDLSGRADTAATALGDLAKTKLAIFVDAIPACRSIAQGVTAARQVQNGQLPECKPSQISGDAVLSLLSGPFDAEINSLIVDRIPDSFTFTQQDLEDLIGASSMQSLDDVRRFVSEGFVYTDADLNRDISRQNSQFDNQDLDVIRDILDDSFVFTQSDFTDRVLEDGTALKNNFEDFRSGLGTARSLWYLVFIAPALILLIIAFLGGRNWNSRLKWAVVPIFISGLAVWIISSPVYDAYAQDEIDTGVIRATEGIERPEARVVATEALNRGVGVLTRWKNGFGNRAGYFAIGSGAVLALSIGYSLFGGRRGRPAPRRTPSGPAPDRQAEAAYEALRKDAAVIRLDDEPHTSSG